MTKKEMMKRFNELIRQESGNGGSDTAVFFQFAQIVLEEHLGIASGSIDYMKAYEQKKNPLLPKTPCYEVIHFTYGRGHARGA